MSHLFARNRFWGAWMLTVPMALAVVAIASANAATLRFGTRTLSIPDPQGFAPLANDVPRYIELAQAYLPATNRLVDAYALPADAKALAAGQGTNLERYFQLQVPRKVDGMPVSESEFSDASKEAESGLEAAFKNSDQLASDLMKQGNSEVKKLTTTDPKVSVSGLGYLGTYRREPWGIFFTIKSKVGAAGSSTDELVCAGALALIDYQLVYLYSYARYRDENDRHWAEQSLSSWADAVRAANPNEPAVAAKADSGFSFSRMLKFGLLGAILAVVVGVVVTIMRKR